MRIDGTFARFNANCNHRLTIANEGQDVLNHMSTQVSEHRISLLPHNNFETHVIVSMVYFAISDNPAPHTRLVPTFLHQLIPHCNDGDLGVGYSVTNLDAGQGWVADYPFLNRPQEYVEHFRVGVAVPKKDNNVKNIIV